MGAFFDLILIRSENSDTVKKALEQVAKEADCKFMLGPPIRGWINAFPSEMGRKDPISASVARLVQSDLFHFIVHDDDIFCYYFYRGGQQVDKYDSCPDYFNEVSEDEIQESKGHPEYFQDLLLNTKSLSKLKKLLAADRFIFESERMVQFVEMFGMPNALTSYDYLSSEPDVDEIEGWKQFVHIENQPVSAEDYNSRGAVRLAKENFDGALADFDKAIDLNPGLLVAQENRRLAELAKNDRNKTLAETLNKYGRIKKKYGELDSALFGYNKAIELNPNYASAYSNRGLLKKNKGDLDGAMADFDKAIELEPNLAEAFTNRGSVKRAKGNLDGAMADFNKAIELKPGSATAHNNRGELKRHMKDLDGALADYDKAIELRPDSPIYFSNRSLAKLRKRDLEGALADCNKAIELKPDFAAAYNNRGMVKQVKEDLDGALEDYDKAVSLKPDLAAVRTNRDKALKIKESRTH